MAVYFMTCTRIVNYPELYRISMSGFLNHSLRSIPIILLSAIPYGFLRLSRIVIIAFNLFLLGFQLLLISVLTYGFFRLSWYFANLIVYFQKSLSLYKQHFIWIFLLFLYYYFGLLTVYYLAANILISNYLLAFGNFGYFDYIVIMKLLSLWNYYYCEIITTIILAH